jgi:RNA polymerase sigma factor (sigma-70 family)
VNSLTDQQLLRDYAERRSEAAFAELVRRHVDLVYSAAVRMVHDAHLAEDVTQGVFVAFAQNARQLTERPVLAGWLHRTAQNIAANAVRTEVRRRVREQEAAAMNEIFATGPDAVWEQIASQLDAALGELGEADRDALLLRYFQRKSAHEIAQMLGISDEAAQKRVSRAVERLREFFAQRGVTVGASGLVAVITANAVQAAPVGLAITISSAAFASVATAGGTLTLLKLMTTTKLKLGVVSAVIVAGVLVVFFLQGRGNDSTRTIDSATKSTSDRATEPADQPSHGVARGGFARREQAAEPVATAEELVANRLAQWGRSRRDIARVIARGQNIKIPDSVELFFDAVERGNWDEIHARFTAICGDQPDASSGGPGRPPGIEPIWPAIFAAYIAAQQVHLWPAQKLVDFGNDVLGSLRPGMVYLGGTDEGRGIPEFLNETRDGERHVVITQNGLADGNYLKYLDFLYHDQLATLTAEDSQRAFDDYVADARKRSLHDQQFPDEPKQMRPGENFKDNQNGPPQVSGQPAVMAINDRLAQALMQKNPDLSFALEESFPLNSSYADASPLGPLLELRASDQHNALTADIATQSVGYWRGVAQQVFSDPEAPDGSETRKTYGHMAAAQADLFAGHDLNEQAEEAYLITRSLWPDHVETTGGLSALLAREGRTDEANQLLNDFLRNYPKQASSVAKIRASILTTVPATKPSN